MLIGKGPGMFGGPVMHGFGYGPAGPPPMRHYHNGCGCCLLPFLIAGVVIATVLVLVFG